MLYPNAGTVNIVFAIPASTAPDLDAAFPGFDPVTQTWGITLASPLPAITAPDLDRRLHAGESSPFHSVTRSTSRHKTISSRLTLR